MSPWGRPAAELTIGPDLVRDLLARQHPDLAHLPLRHVTAGWDNEVFRLGDDLALRLPRRAVAAPLLEHELRWLPALATDLPLAVPVPLRAGLPDAGFPWSWAVVPWLRGEITWLSPPDDAAEAARTVGSFVAAFSRPAPDDAPVNPFRGVPLRERNGGVTGRLEHWGAAAPVDPEAVRASWEESLTVPPHAGPPRWLHGDLHPANLLVDGGRLSAVLDFGDLTAGDPATDLSVAWMLFDRAGRDVFRDAAGAPDDDIWLRARGNALAHGLACLSTQDPVMSAIGRTTVDAVLSDDRPGQKTR